MEDLNPFDLLAEEYDSWFDKEGKIVFETELLAFKKILPLLPKPWLEIGVGSGRFAQALGIEVGIDPSIKLLEMAKSRGIEVYQVKGEDRFFKEESFGAVFMIVTLCFVDSPIAVLREANRILRPDGKVVLGLVLKDSPWGRLYLAKKMEGHRFYRYANFYSFEEIEGFLLDSGFRIEKVVSTLFQEPDNVKEIELPRDGFSRSAGFTVILGNKVFS
ncbi:methyltransferase domain-containing protein [bacterium]|nr:methyltransferase domain-containing protein [bacterium]